MMIQEIRGKKEWSRTLRPPRPSLPPVNFYQLTGIDREGRHIYIIGSFREMERRKEYFRQHGGTGLLIAERKLIETGLIAQEVY